MSEIEIVKAFQKISNKFWDIFFYIFSQLGTELCFIAVALAIYWCVSKKDGYRFINVYFIGQIFVGVFKAIFKRTRPYESGARAIMEKTDGYSFPSGHSATAANISTQLILLSKVNLDKTGNKEQFVTTACAGSALTLLVMFSRVYLGQHYPSDVIFGAAWGIISALIFTAAFNLLREREENIVFFIVPVSIIMLIVLIILKGSVDYVKMTGAYGAVALGYFLEKRFVGYNVKSGKVYKQIIKFVLGIAIILVIKEGLKAVLTLLSPNQRVLILLDFIRYAFIGITGALLMPLIFKKTKL